MNGIVSGKTEKSTVEDIITSLPKTNKVLRISSNASQDLSAYNFAILVDDTNRYFIFPQSKCITSQWYLSTSQSPIFFYNTYSWYTSGINAHVSVDLDKSVFTVLKDSQSSEVKLAVF